MDVIGQDSSTEMNNLGNRKISDAPSYSQNSEESSSRGTVNVYAVAIISSDTKRRGLTKQLIQSVAMGTI